MPLNQIRISVRLGATFAALIALLLVIALGAAWQLDRLHRNVRELAQVWLPGVELVNQIDAKTAALRIAELRHIGNADAAVLVQLERTMDTLIADVAALSQRYESTIATDAERQAFEAFRSDWNAFVGLHGRVMERSRRNEAEAAMQIVEGESQQRLERYGAHLQELVRINHDGGIRSAAESDGSYRQALTVLALAAVFAAALAAVAAVVLTRSITVPLARALAAADRVASGDLSGRLEAEGRDEAARLLQSLQRMQASLVATVTAVRGNAESVSTASSQFAQGNADLSQRTEEQASSLQQTAATMDELGSTVRHNADNAQRANALAEGASAVAVRGGERVDAVVETMRGIQDSSRRIAEIIGVIDGIAFHTNILALNAAVEAARAGEQGRGFAVVAGEVRTLAQRSGEAAREIKTLITSSVEQVERGTGLVDEAGRTMDEVVEAIRRVSDLVGEISSASREQSEGVSQVGHAVSTMDQVTQQNAALVEQSAAAAESLRQQAQSLVKAVDTFRLETA